MKGDKNSAHSHVHLHPTTRVFKKKPAWKLHGEPERESRMRPAYLQKRYCVLLVLWARIVSVTKPKWKQKFCGIRWRIQKRGKTNKPINTSFPAFPLSSLPTCAQVVGAQQQELWMNVWSETLLRLPAAEQVCGVHAPSSVNTRNLRVTYLLQSNIRI